MNFCMSTKEELLSGESPEIDFADTQNLEKTSHESIEFKHLTSIRNPIHGCGIDCYARYSVGVAGRRRRVRRDGWPTHRQTSSVCPKAKRVIFLFATGGVWHIDTFDPKSSANGRDGSGKDKLMGSDFPYSSNKRCGTEVSDLFPHLRDNGRHLRHPIDEVRALRPHRSGCRHAYRFADIRAAEHGVVAQLRAGYV